MKKIALVVLASGLLAAPLFSAAQDVAAPDTCPCAEPGFVALTQKAKDVAKFWDARKDYKRVGQKISKVTSGITALFSAAFKAELNPNSREAAATIYEARDRMQAQEDALAALRDAAVRSGGLTLLVPAGDKAKKDVSDAKDPAQDHFVVTLTQGVDYDILKNESKQAR